VTEVEDWSGEISEVATLETLLPTTEAEQSGALIPVFLQSRVTEIGSGSLSLIFGKRERSDRVRG